MQYGLQHDGIREVKINPLIHYHNNENWGTDDCLMEWSNNQALIFLVKR